MTRNSTATVRERPLADVTSTTGTFKVHAETLTVDTDARVQILDVTEHAAGVVARSAVSEGTVSLVSLHTTCAVFVNEYQRALLDDVETFLARLIDQHGDWRHNDPACSDCDRLNADAHLRALLLGHSLTLQVADGELVLGQWQRILLAELDGPRARSLRASVMGV